MDSERSKQAFVHPRIVELAEEIQRKKGLPSKHAAYEEMERYARIGMDAVRSVNAFGTVITKEDRKRKEALPPWL